MIVFCSFVRNYFYIVALMFAFAIKSSYGMKYNVKVRNTFLWFCEWADIHEPGSMPIVYIYLPELEMFASATLLKHDFSHRRYNKLYRLCFSFHEKKPKLWSSWIPQIALGSVAWTFMFIFQLIVGAPAKLKNVQNSYQHSVVYHGFGNK